MATVFKYKFYNIGEVAPSWLTDTNTIQHDNIPANSKPSPTMNAPIDSAMDYALPITSPILAAMNVWSNYLDISFSDSSGTKSITYGGWNPGGDFGSATTFTENGATGNYAILYNKEIKSGVDLSQADIGNWGGWAHMHEFLHIFIPNQKDIGGSPDLRQTILYYPTRLPNGEIDPSVKIPLTPGMTDIYNLQNGLNGAPKYGESTLNSSDSTYSFKPTEITLGVAAPITGLDLNKQIGGYVLTIWDSAGNDTIDASTIGNVNVNITLVEEKFSSIGNTEVGIAKNAKIENAIGGAGDDTIRGNDLANKLEGNAGQDYLNGGAGVDELIGGEDNDILDGGTDANGLGDKADDILDGGNGFDTYIIHKDEHDTIKDSDGNGQIRYVDGDKLINLAGAFIKEGESNQWQYALADGSFATLSHNSPWKLTMPDGTVIELGENFTDGDFGINLVENSPTPETTRDIIGDLKPEDQDPAEEGIQPGNDDLGNIIVTAEVEANRVDTLNDSAGNDHIRSLGGNDHIYLTRGGNDWVQGGAGDDIVQSSLATGKALIEGNAGADQLFGGTQDDTIYGGDKLDLTEAISQGATQTASSSKGDWLDGASGDDVLVGTATADVLVAGDGDDILVGGGGDDTIYGDSATLNLPRDWTITRETIVHTDYTEYKVTGNVIDLPSSVGVGGNDNLLGGAGNDWMFGADGDDVMDGGNDNDVLFGDDGMDLLDGGDGDDVLAGGAGDDYIIGGEGNDKLNGADFNTQTIDGNDYLDGGNGDDNISGNAGDDILQGGDDTDALFGGADNDTLDGGTGNDFMNGGTGDDIYKITNLEDHDSIEDESGNDTLSVGVSWDAVTVRRAGTTIGLYWSADVNQYVAIRGGTSGAINSFEFSDKTLSIAEVLKRINPEDYDNVTGGAESPTLGTGGAPSNMSNTANTPDATSNTAYQIQNAMLATVNDAGGIADVVDFGTNVISSQASYMRLTNDDLLITLDTGAEITIKQHYAADNTHRIENIQFADATIDTATLDSLTPSIATASQGNDILLGTTGDDEIYGLAGNDTLKGGTGNDTYLFAQGDGADTIVENDATTANLDTLLLVDIQSTEVSLQRVGADLIISSTITPTSTDKITIQAYFTSTANAIEQLSFSDGVIWSTADINALVKINGTVGDDFLQGYSNSNDRLYGLAGNDQLQGNSGDDLLDGGSGNDTLLGQVGKDTLDGGTGNDVLQGNSGDDVYLFNLGGGRDVIWEEGDTSGDVLRFGAEITPTDMIVYKSGADLVLSHVNGIDQVTIKNWYVSASYQLKQFEFADGTIWNGSDTATLARLRGTPDNDTIYGTSLPNETLYGMAGNDSLIAYGGDVLIGGLGNDTITASYGYTDTLVFTLGDGADTISVRDEYARDTLRFEAGILSTEITADRVGYDLILRHTNGTDSVTVTDWYSPASYSYKLSQVTFVDDGVTWSATTLSNMATNINHSYSLNLGDGAKTIEDWGGTDTLTISSAISEASVIISRVGLDLLISHTNGVDKVTIKDWFNDTAKQIENIIFASNGTVLTKSQITTPLLTLTGTVGDDVLQGGDAYAETILGLGGNDTLYGSAGDDQLTGGTGNDQLTGGTGNDTYYFNQGDGQDTIIGSYGDKLIFGAGLLSTLTASGGGSQDTIYSFGTGADKVTVKAGGTVGAYFISYGTELTDNFTGSIYGDYVYGLAGNDTLIGGAGSDELNGGDGDDILDGYALTGTTDEQLYGSDVGDVYIGGKGNDTLNGNVKNDTYYFNLGDGNDVIAEGFYLLNGIWQTSSDDILRFGTGITLDSLQFSKLGSDLLVKVSATDSITIKNWFSDYKYWVDSFRFIDGQMRSGNDITRLALTVHGSAGDDVMTGDTTWSNTIYGESGNDTLTGGNTVDQLYGGVGNDTLQGNGSNDQLYGGLGADNLQGGSGDDSYYFSKGDGNDTISDASGIDAIYFDATVSASNLTLSRNVNDLVLTNTQSGDVITIANYVSQPSFTFRFGNFGTYGKLYPDYKVENFVFADGSSLPSSDQIMRLLNATGTANDDILSGAALVDIIYGGDGNDVLYGLDGDDTLFGENGDDQLYGGNGNDNISAGLGNDLLVGGDGSEILIGNGGDDTFIGGGGTDYLVGETGADTYFYNIGDGYDEIYDYGAPLPDQIDRIVLGSGIEFSNLTFARWNDDLDITISGNTITIKNHFYANNYAAVERLELAGGDSIGLTDVQISSGTITGSAVDSLLIGSSTNDTLNGGAGNDWLQGGSGSDTMIGGTGNDIYFVDYRNDVVTEQLNEGTDTVHSSVAFTLGNNVENLTLTGTAGVSGTGNALDNIFRGNSAANAFTGGAGNDTYYLSTGDSAVEGVGAGTDVVYTDATYTMGTNIENGFIIGTAAVNLTGNALANIITGNAAANILNGGAGVDTLTGGLGDDTYIIDVATDVVVENANEGNDTIQVGYATTATTTLTTGVGQFTNIENITVTGTGLYNLTGDAANNTLIGNASANVLTGNAGNDVLNGLAGIDNMSGGFGNDTYTVDVAGDVVTENLNEGTDLVNVAITTKSGTYTLGNNIENGTLINAVAFTLTGNALDNILNGNGVANTLNGGDGNDVLDGKAGIDNMSGGLGNDTYFVDVAGDVVTEAVGAGTDSVNVGIATASGTYTLGANIENGKLTNTVAFNLTGNVLNNYLMGNIANNTLTDTAGGNDILQGLAGIDTFNDTVGNNLFDGGVGNDIMTGGSGRDLFIGGLGVDTITSGTGYDVIAFNKGDGQDTVNASTGADNTLSLGGNFAYSDLSLTKSTNDLILKMGITDQITLKDWYLGTTNKSVVNLQVIAEAIQGFSLGSADDLRNNKIENFNFASLVSQFDAEGATANWQLTDARLTTHLQAGSDSAAIGGDLAYQYGMNSNLTGMGLSNTQSVIAAASFGQTAQTLNNPSVWQAEVVKLA